MWWTKQSLEETHEMSDVENVTPEVIDAPEVISGADKWLAEQRSKVSSIADEYRPHEITSAKDYKDSKRARASARKAIKEVEDARRQQVGAIKSAVRDFEAQVRDLLEPLSTVDAEYKEALAQWETLVVDSRTQEIEAWYEESQGDVARLVPFDALWRRFADEGKWGLFSSNLVAIEDDVASRARGIERDLDAIRSYDLRPEDEANVKTEYLRTLDLSTALRNAEEARKAREALLRAAEERRKREAEAEESERQQRTAEERAARERAEAEESERQQRLADAEAARQRRIETGQERQAPAGQSPEVAMDGAPKTIVFEVTVPEDKLGQFIGAMKSMDGVHGRKIGVR